MPSKSKPKPKKTKAQDAQGKEKDNTKEKTLCDTKCRHAEYYDMQGTFDDLYARSKRGEIFEELMPLILSRSNILLAYRNIKANGGSLTPGTDNLTIRDIDRLAPDEVVCTVRSILTDAEHGYTPRPIRRKEIPKPYDPSKKRPLGIPCIWDRLAQQCCLQVMEPICEARFSNNSYGFRPNRSAENAIAAAYDRIWHSKTWFSIEFDVKGFFDNVDHAKLMRQLWTIGIRDKLLLFIIRRMLTAPIRMPDGSLTACTAGTPQGGILSPLLANVVLNELDKWIESQWEENPLAYHGAKLDGKGHVNKGKGYALMRKTKLKEMYIIRYADDFRILCKTKDEAERILTATTKWLKERLRLEVSPEKTRIVNVRSRYTEFLGFKMKVVKKGNKLVTRSHVCDKALTRKGDTLIEQAKRIARPKGKGIWKQVNLFNSMVTGMQNYYCIATSINRDFAGIQWRLATVMHNRLDLAKPDELHASKHRKLTKFEKDRYGASDMLRYETRSGFPIYPIGYVQFKAPKRHSPNVTCYSAKGRVKLHSNLRINTHLMHSLMYHPPPGLSLRGADCCISRFSAQWGKCAISKVEFSSLSDICCYHIYPSETVDKDQYRNIILVTPVVRSLLEASSASEFRSLSNGMDISEEMLASLNKYRMKAGLPAIF